MEQAEGWIIENNVLGKEFVFKDFFTVIQFINEVALWSEKYKHHPVWTNNYNKLKITLFTDSENSITEKDYQLASKINDILEAKYICK